MEREREGKGGGEKTWMKKQGKGTRWREPTCGSDKNIAIMYMPLCSMYMLASVHNFVIRSLPK